MHLQPLTQLLHKQSLYAGVKKLIYGKSPEGFRITKTNGHADPYRFAIGSPERFQAFGNEAADRNAKAGALLHGQPRDEEVQKFNNLQQVLRRYLLYVPRALELWPSVSPGRAADGSTLTFRALDIVPDESAREGDKGYLADVLSGWRSPSISRMQGQDAGGGACSAAAAFLTSPSPRT